VSLLQPLSDEARERTATAFSEALKSVFISTTKLGAFHALFTWLTYRYPCDLLLIFAPVTLLPLVLESASSGDCMQGVRHSSDVSEHPGVSCRCVPASGARLPGCSPCSTAAACTGMLTCSKFRFLTYFPANMVMIASDCTLYVSRLLLQGRSISAIMLSVLHVLAYYVGDAIIMAEVRLTAHEPQPIMECRVKLTLSKYPSATCVCRCQGRTASRHLQRWEFWAASAHLTMQYRAPCSVRSC
jgi:hypothetical protein